MEWGDRLAKALDSIGLSSQEIERWLGRPCGCAERQEKLNQLGRWVTRVLAGKTDRAKEWMTDIMKP
jgi:hypothetical protein